MNKKDLSQNCNFDDDSGKNDCWHCKYFLFPIGCMYGEVALNTRNLTDEETDIYNKWLEAEAETIGGVSLFKEK